MPEPQRKCRPQNFAGFLEMYRDEFAPGPRKIDIVCSHKYSNQPSGIEIGLLALCHCNQSPKPGKRCGLGDPLCVA